MKKTIILAALLVSANLYAQKISELPTATGTTGFIPIIEGGVSKKILTDSIKTKLTNAQKEIGINSNLSIASFSRNNNRYEAFPVTVKRQNVLYQMFVSQVNHVTPNTELCYVKSLDGGATWSNKIIIAIEDNDGFSFGVTKSGRLLALVSKGGTTPNKIYRSGINDDIFTLVQTIPGTAGQSWINFGKIKQMPSGRILSNTYRYDVGNEKAGFLSSVDDGLTWSYYADIAANGNENAVEIISGTTDANTVLMSILRRSDNNNSANRVYKSINGGLTWTLVGNVPFEIGKNIGYGFPADIYKDEENGRLWISFGARFLPISELVNWNIPITDYDALANWHTQRSYYVASIKGNSNDFGYSSLYKWGNDIFTSFYDVSPRAKGALVSDSTVIINLKLSSNVSAIFRRVQYPIYSTVPFSKIGLVKYRESATFFEQRNVQFVIIPEDGVYTAKARAVFDNTPGGTFRKLGLALLDTGYPIDQNDLFPHNPINNAVAPEAIEYIHTQTNPYSANIDVRTMEFTATFYAKKGYEIMLFGKHDNTTPVTVYVTDVELKIEKIK